MKPLSDEAKECRNQYARSWRAKNKDRVKKHNNDFWERHAKQQAEVGGVNDENILPG